ncbi:MAG: secretin N-terminal domain-containing protein [Candidatus Puniceispirillales bacterium]
MKSLFAKFLILLSVILFNATNALSEIAFSFDKVNLVSVMNVLSVEIKRNITIEDGIDEKISLIINHPIDREKIISSLQNSLKLKDIILFEKENGDLLIKKNQNVIIDAPLSKKGLSGFQIFIVNLKNIDPNSMVPFLSQFFPETNKIKPSPNGKSLTFIGNKSDYQRLISLVKKFDTKPNQKGLQINLKNTKSEEIFAIIKSLIDGGNWLINPNNEVSIVNIKKLNAVYVTAPQNSINQLKKFIEDLDKVDTALDLEDKITIVEEKTTTISNSNLKNEHGFDVISLKHSDANEIQNTIIDITNLDVNIEDNISRSSNSFSIKSYVPGNKIIISGNTLFRNKIISLIQDLDKPIKQVFVEAIVAELSSSKAKELGLQFSGSSGKAGLSILNNNSLGANISSQTTSFISDGIGITLGPGAKKITSIGALINIIENDGNSEILATPTLLAMNNREAQILVGSNIPIITGKFTSNSSDSANSPFQTITRQDVGIIFKIKPIIGSDGLITINVLQEVSELDTSSALAADVVTTKRAIETSAVVRTGKTLAIGGLINESTQYLGAKLPILGDLPGFKEIFNQRRVSTSKRNLVIFLKPSIVTNNEVSKITFEKYMRLKNDLDKSRSKNYFNIDYPPLPLIEGL